MIVAVAGWRSVGVSTAALLLAAAAVAQGEQAWLVEADPAGGVLAGRSVLLAGRPGEIAELALGRSPVESLLSSDPLLGGVRVVLGAPDPFAAWSSLANPRVGWIDAVRRLPGVVVVDAGSMRGGATPAWRLIDIADVVVMVATSDPVSVVSTLAWCDAKGQSAPDVTGLLVEPRLLVVDAPGAVERLDAGSLTSALGGRLVGWWPWEPPVVDAVLRGATLDHRRLARQQLTRAVVSTTAMLWGSAP